MRPLRRFPSCSATRRRPSHSASAHIAPLRRTRIKADGTPQRRGVWPGPGAGPRAARLPAEPDGRAASLVDEGHKRLVHLPAEDHLHNLEGWRRRRRGGARAQAGLSARSGQWVAPERGVRSSSSTAQSCLRVVARAPRLHGGTVRHPEAVQELRLNVHLLEPGGVGRRREEKRRQSTISGALGGEEMPGQRTIR